MADSILLSKEHLWSAKHNRKRSQAPHLHHLRTLTGRRLCNLFVPNKRERLHIMLLLLISWEKGFKRPRVYFLMILSRFSSS